MSLSKRLDEQKRMREEKAWNHVARSKGFVCKEGGEIITKEEVQSGMTDICSYHRSVRMKD